MTFRQLWANLTQLVFSVTRPKQLRLDLLKSQQDSRDSYGTRDNTSSFFLRIRTEGVGKKFPRRPDTSAPRKS